MSASTWAPIADIASDVASGKASASELVEKSLALIDEKKDFQAIIATTSERARRRAGEIDRLVASGKNPGRLAGVPFIAKDNFLTLGGETTAASNMLKGFNAPYQATVIERLEKEGAICVAKANLDAFAHGSSTENSDFFTTKNPHDETRVPGGSSGGSAASVALGLAPFSIGTDTGGSIRLPASFCGVVGYKPTYGLVSRSGIVAMASSCDAPGPLAASVDDAALVVNVIAGRDELDSTSIDREDTYMDLAGDLKGKTIGVSEQSMDERVSPGVRKVIDAGLEKLAKAGASIKRVSLPTAPYGLATYYVIQTAEVSSNLSRYDGQRYPYSAPDAKNLDESYEQSRSIGFGPEAKRRIILGTFVLSSGYYDAYYRKAQLVRSKIISEYEKVFSEVDFLAGPTAADTAFKIGEVQDPLQMYLTDIMTVGANLAGLPAISIPAGASDKGMPVGLQLMAPQKRDRELLAAARAAEEVLV